MNSPSGKRLAWGALVLLLAVGSCTEPIATASDADQLVFKVP
jgi:hypothetical protein